MLPTKYASFDRRFTAFVVDWLLSWLLALILVAPTVWLLVPASTISELSRLCGLPGYDFTEIHISGNELCELVARLVPWYLPVGAVSVFILATILYYALFESSRRQATPGKMLVGIFVTDLQGKRIGFWRAVVRTMAKAISKLILYFGFALALFSSRNQALHDLFAGTLVLEPALQAAPKAKYPAKPATGPGGRNSEGLVHL